MNTGWKSETQFDMGERCLVLLAPQTGRRLKFEFAGMCV